MFLIAVLLAILGLPLFLISSGALISDDLTRHFKATDSDEGFSSKVAGEGVSVKKTRDGTPEDPLPPLDISDLKGLGGLVGLVVLIILAFGMFPEDIGGLSEIMKTNARLTSAVWTIGGQHAAASQVKPQYMSAPAFADRSSAGGSIDGMAPQDGSDEGYIIIDTTHQSVQANYDPDPLDTYNAEYRPTMLAVSQSASFTPLEGYLDTTTLAYQQLAVLRTHPLLLMGYSDAPLSPTMYYFFILGTLPILFAFYKLNADSSKSEILGRNELKRLALEKKAKADSLKMKRNAEIEGRKQRLLEGKIKKIEDHVMRTQFGVQKAEDKPWWAPATWRSTSQEEIDVIKSQKMKQVGRKVFNEVGVQDSKWMPNYGAAHHAAWSDHQVAKAGAESYKATADRLAAKWDKEKNPYPGIDPRITRESAGSSAAVKEKEMERHSRAEEVLNYRKAREWARLIRKGSKSSKSSTPALRLEWDKEEAEEKKRKEMEELPIVQLGGHQAMLKNQGPGSAASISQNGYRMGSRYPNMMGKGP